MQNEYVLNYLITGDGVHAPAHLHVPTARVVAAPDPAVVNLFPQLTRDRDLCPAPANDRIMAGVRDIALQATRTDPVNSTRNTLHCAPVAGMEYDYFQGLPLDRLESNRLLRPDAMPFAVNTHTHTIVGPR
jgi:hypothetical protein